MTYVRFNKPDRSFNNLMDDLFTQVPSLLGNDLFPNRVAPVNIRETEKDFVLELVAPGLEKQDFRINLDNNTLTISVEKKEEARQEYEMQIRTEYRQQAFSRSFTVDEKIDTENIAATYTNGVLT